MAEILYAPTTPGQGQLKDRGSRFLAFAYPCEDQAQGDSYLADLKKRYHDARHHCYAFRLGKQGATTWANDDGEPAHSAGDPILAAIRAQGLTNVWVGVIRYFGGTKLGVRGLIDAYRSAAEAALAEVERTEVIEQVVFALDYAYDQTAEVSRILHPYRYEAVEAEYQATVRQVLAIRKEHFAALRQQLVAAQLSVEIVAKD